MEIVLWSIIGLFTASVGIMAIAAIVAMTGSRYRG